MKGLNAVQSFRDRLRKQRKVWNMLLLTVLLSPVLAAAAADSPVRVAAGENVLGGIHAVKVIGACLIVLLLVFVLAWFLKRLNYATGGNGLLRVTHSLSLGSREKILIVEVAGHFVMLGVTPAGIQNLMHIDAAALNASNDTHGQEKSIHPFIQQLIASVQGTKR